MAMQTGVRLAAAVAAAVVFQGWCSAAEKGMDWPNWRGPEHNGISQESAWAQDISTREGRLLWTASVNTGYSSFSVSDGLVYTMGNTGKSAASEQEQEDIVYCLDGATGKKIWSYAYRCPLGPVQYEGGPNATPTIDAGCVYTWGKNAMVHCFEAKTGRLLWAKDLSAEYDIKLAKHGLASSPLIIGDLLLLNGCEHTIALDKTKQGQMVWKTSTRPGSQGAGYSTPVPYTLNGQLCLAVFQAEGALGMTVSEGKVMWEYPWETAWNLNVADPVVFGDKVFLSSGYNAGCVLISIRDNKPVQVWRNKNMANHFNSSIYHNGFLYGFDQSELKCLDAADGSVKWGFRGLGKGSLMIAADKLVLLSERGRLVIAEATPQAYQPLFEKDILKGQCWTPPVLSHGRVYARNSQGDAVCVDLNP